MSSIAVPEGWRYCGKAGRRQGCFASARQSRTTAEPERCALRAKAHGWVQREAFRIWTAHGGDLTLRQFREELASGREEPDPEHSEIPAIFGRIFRRMRPWHEDGDLFFVHGGVAPDHPEESLAAFSDPAGTPDGANASEATWDTPYHYACRTQPQISHPHSCRHTRQTPPSGPRPYSSAAGRVHYATGDKCGRGLRHQKRGRNQGAAIPKMVQDKNR